MGCRWIWTVVLLILSAHAFADDIDDCNATSDQARAIKGCTALIDRGKLSGRNAAHAYANRASAEKEAGNSDAAIADYTKAIELGHEDALNRPGFAGESSMKCVGHCGGRACSLRVDWSKSKPHSHIGKLVDFGRQPPGCRSTGGEALHESHSFTDK